MAVGALVISIGFALAVPVWLAKRREGSERTPIASLRQLASAEAEPEANKEYSGYFIRRQGRIYVAYPAKYSVTGRMTYVLDEEGLLWKKDTGGVAPQDFPPDPAAAGWSR
jgi:hypothetical protein